MAAIYPDGMNAFHGPPHLDTVVGARGYGRRIGDPTVVAGSSSRSACAPPGPEDAPMTSEKPDADTSITLMMRLREAPADLHAWDEFVRRYQPMIRDWCLKWGSRPEDAEDVAQ